MKKKCVKKHHQKLSENAKYYYHFLISLIDQKFKFKLLQI